MFRPVSGIKVAVERGKIPVKRCMLDGKDGWQWGGSGRCYTFKKGDAVASRKAHAKAVAQGRAAYMGGYRKG